MTTLGAEQGAEQGAEGRTARPGIMASFSLFGDSGYRAYWLANFVYFLVFGAQRFAFVLLVLELSDNEGLGARSASPSASPRSSSPCRRASGRTAWTAARW